VTMTGSGPLDGPPTEGKLTEEDAQAHVHGICFKTGPPHRVGVELEWLVRDARDPALPVPAERTVTAVADLTAPAVLPSPATLPSGSMLTTEPGGQLELSSAPADSLGECVTAVRREMTTLREAVGRAGLTLQGYGYDPVRRPLRVLDLPRYAAMEEFFDRTGPWGRQMMCNTASVQVCLDAGQETTVKGGYRWRWRLAHHIGPVLVAAFANSPLRQGRPSGWRSTRQQVWAHLDPGRTLPPPNDGDPRDAYASYALDAELMLIRRDGGPSWVAPRGLTFRGWLRGELGSERPATIDDLTYHLSTLFPPVRPRGHLELRMIDAQCGDGWIVPAAVAWALLEDPCAADTAMAAAEPLWAHQGDGGAGTTPQSGLFGSFGQFGLFGLERARNDGRPDAASTGAGNSGHNGHRAGNPAPSGNPWLRAARDGPADPLLARASQQCFEAADAALGRAGTSAEIRRRVAEFAERYVLRSRCPADDQLEGMK
jgi:glutamate--cysteine ligase